MFSIILPKLFKTSIKKTPIIKPNNRINPIKTEFNSTKELFNYAKKRCIDALNSPSPYEHALILKKKKNKIIAEYLGDYKGCFIEDLNILEIDRKNTTIVHGHPENYPISITDINTLINSGINKVIAFNTKGEFSLVAKQQKLTPEYLKYFKKMENETDVERMEHNDFYKSYLDYNLRTHIPLMGLRYVSNYTFLK